jgi:hypothetical protein
MKYKKKELAEIIDGNGELIGKNDIPDVDKDADTQAKNTSDYNAKVGTQPFRYDMLGRFGFTLMPFMEGEEKNQGQTELVNDVSDELFDLYLEILENFYRNPNKIKSEFRVIAKEKADGSDKNALKDNIKFNFNKYSEKLIKIFEKHLDESLKNLDEQFQENIVEGKVLEVIVDKKEDEMTTKTDDKEVREKKIEKIAGLINKLEKKDIDKLVNLLEKKNG